MTSFNITSGSVTTQQALEGGETGRVAAGASLLVPVATAVFLNPSVNGVFNGTFANPTLDNAGTISGGSDAIYLETPFAGTVYIRNTGSVVSTVRQAFISFSDAVGSIVFDNAGSLTSALARTVEFGGGDDMFVIRNGSSTSGIVDGAGGTDWLN